VIGIGNVSPRMNKKGIPDFLKRMEGRMDEYIILYEVGGKLTLHGWVTKSRRKGTVSFAFLF